MLYTSFSCMYVCIYLQVFGAAEYGQRMGRHRVVRLSGYLYHTL